jgi:hypothetical protein
MASNLSMSSRSWFTLSTTTKLRILTFQFCR